MTAPISHTLRAVRAGSGEDLLMDNAADKLAELVRAVADTGKPGTLTITVKVRKATAGALAITGDAKVKTPPQPVVESLMFPTVDGDLLTEDPRQTKLDLKPVAEEPTRTLRTVGN